MKHFYKKMEFYLLVVGLAICMIPVPKMNAQTGIGGRFIVETELEEIKRWEIELDNDVKVLEADLLAAREENSQLGPKNTHLEQRIESLQKQLDTAEDIINWLRDEYVPAILAGKEKSEKNLISIKKDFQDLTKKYNKLKSDRARDQYYTGIGYDTVIRQNSHLRIERFSTRGTKKKSFTSFLFYLRFKPDMRGLIHMKESLGNNEDWNSSYKIVCEFDKKYFGYRNDDLDEPNSEYWNIDQEGYTDDATYREELKFSLDRSSNTLIFEVLAKPGDIKKKFDFRKEGYTRFQFMVSFKLINSDGKTLFDFGRRSINLTLNGKNVEPQLNEKAL